MLTHRFLRMAAGTVLCSALCATLVQAQASPSAPQSSLGDAARKVRQQNQGRQPGKVYSNDDIADVKGSVSIVGTEPTPLPAAGAGAAADAAGAAAVSASPAMPKVEVKDEAYWRAQFAAARKLLASDSKELDVLQREYNLKELQFYSNPNVALREQNSRADLNKTRDEIEAKKTDVAKDQQAITDLEDQLRKAGGDSGWGRAK